MKQLWLGITAVSLLAGTFVVAAQDLPETFSTSGGLTVSVPAGADTSEASANSVSLTLTDGTIGATTITIEANAVGDSFSLSGGNPSTPQGLVNTTLSSMSIMVNTADIETETTTLNNGEAVYAVYSLLGGMMSMTGETPEPGVTLGSAADSIVAGVLLDNGVLVGLTATSFTITGGSIADQTDLILAILGSATIEPGSEIEASVALIAAQRAADPLTYLEAGTAVFTSGAILTFDPEVFSYSADDSESLNDDMVSLQRVGGIDTVSMQLFATDEVDNSFMMSAQMMAGMSGDDSFDAETSFETVTTENGDLRLYNSSDHATETGFVSTVLGILPLDNDFSMTYQLLRFGSSDGGDQTQVIVDLANQTSAVDASDVQAIIDAAEAAAAENTPEGVTDDSVGNLNTEGVFEALCSSSLYSLTTSPEAGDTVEFQCPTGCTAGNGTVWGTDIYTSDSAVCVAAVHAGAITASEGGLVTVSVLPDQDAYMGSENNGITTNDYGSWGLSYSVAAAAAQ